MPPSRRSISSAWPRRCAALPGERCSRCCRTARRTRTGSRSTAMYDALLANRCDRKTTLVALGGGVVGDMTGFAAACYMRGVPFVQVPTTLLAQVDSSVGGKTGDQPPARQEHGRRLLPAARVLADLDMLDTLAAARTAAGLAEVIKHGAIADAAFLRLDRREHRRAAVARDPDALAHAIARSCEIKAEVVARTSAKRPARDAQFRPHLRPCDRDRASATANGCTARRSAAAW